MDTDGHIEIKVTLKKKIKKNPVRFSGRLEQKITFLELFSDIQMCLDNISLIII